MGGISNRGFASMSDGERTKLARMGGSASGGNFKYNPKRASEAGKKGAAAQPLEAKRRGGAHSHRNR